MALWKTFTVINTKDRIDVNMDQVCFIHEREGRSTIYFVGGRNDRYLSIDLKETLEEIHAREGTKSDCG
jgi:hypothetical protein